MFCVKSNLIRCRICYEDILLFSLFFFFEFWIQCSCHLIHISGVLISFCHYCLIVLFSITFFMNWYITLSHTNISRILSKTVSETHNFCCCLHEFLYISGTPQHVVNFKVKLNPFAVKMLMINRYFDISAAKKDLKYEPLIDFEQGWASTIDWFKIHWLPKYNEER